MKWVSCILAALMGGCWGSAIISLFKDKIGFGLGMFVIGCLSAVFYLVCWIIEAE